MKKKIIKSITFLFIIVIFFIIGRYLSGAVFLKLINHPLSEIQFNTLSLYNDNSMNIIKYKNIAYLINVVFGLIPVVLILIVFFSLKNKRKLYGNARFASDQDLEKSGLFFKGKKEYPDVLVGKMATGKFKDHFIKFANQQFISVKAPTRSGKGVDIVIPNCLNYRDSIVVLDIKLENFKKTAGYRESMGQEVYLFSPDGFNVGDGKLKSHKWNPLFYIRRNTMYRVGDCYNIANILYPLVGDAKTDIWNQLAQKVFVGLVLYMLDLEDVNPNVTLTRLIDLTNQDEGFAKWCANVVRNGDHLSDQCKSELNSFSSSAGATQGSIFSNLIAPLGIFKDGVTSESVSGNDFNFSDIRKKRMSIYVGVQPRNIDKFSTLINLFFSQLISENTAELPEDNHELKYQALLVLDEFTSIGRVNIILKSVAYTAGYNIRYLFIYQSKGQLSSEANYGKDGAETLISNTAMKVIFPPSKVDEDAKEISESLGYYTMKHRNRSKTYSTQGSRTDNNTEEKRALMMPQEVVELGYENYKMRNGKEITFKINKIIMSEGIRPFKAKKIVYFDEPVFMKRVEFSEKNIPKIPNLLGD